MKQEIFYSDAWMSFRLKIESLIQSGYWIDSAVWNSFEGGMIIAHKKSK